jgi:hypothetical protein
MAMNSYCFRSDLRPQRDAPAASAAAREAASAASSGLSRVGQPARWRSAMVASAVIQASLSFRQAM